MTPLQTLGEMMRERTAVAAPELVEQLDDGKVRCFACGHRCMVAPGRSGVCRVRFNEGGVLRVPHGYVAALQCDPIEKKPFFHALPGTDAFSFGMLGCDLHCGYCQNWVTSQALRDPAAEATPRDISADELVGGALRLGASTVASTYNEPLITAEWAVEVFRKAKQSGLRCAFISNGNGTPEVLDYLRPHLDFYKVDLKGFDDQNYRRLGGVLKHVCDTIVMLKERGVWVEIVTLLVPGFNDSEDEVRKLTAFVASVDPEMPWHVTAFHSDYKMTDRGDTETKSLLRAAEMGREAGLRFVYAGNRPGWVGKWENTYCPGCDELLVERHGFHVRSNRLAGTGRCPSCQRTIPGVWS
ncbi:MAG: AmmeMemoRadiSam system radical SAM enzyme [Candidatus Sumerlaeaceae bacterium]|nr:AmmeMemoRadiSam system radical SAM enzyme [Candidatus Sumerlaeaceae bacterium]